MDDKVVKIVEFLKNAKCKNVSAYDLSENGEAKFFVLSSVQTADDNKKVADELSKNFELTDEIDGYHKGEWIILNFDKIYVHLFIQTAREHYNLDRLYKSKFIDLAKFIKKKKSK